MRRNLPEPPTTTMIMMMLAMKIVAFALVAIAMAQEPAVKKAAAADGPKAAVMYTEGNDL